MLKTDANPEFCDRFYFPNTPWKKLALNYYKLPAYYSFDLATALEEMRKVTTKTPLAPFTFESKSGKTRQRKSYRGVGLSYRPQAKEPLYDALDLYTEDGKLNIYETFSKVAPNVSAEARIIEPLYENDFTLLTEACTPFFQKIIKKFKSRYTKIRFLELMPGGFIPPHVDFPYYKGIRLHSVLTTNKDVFWEVNGETFQLPSDGNFYWFDTGKYHAVANKGDSSRIVLSINLQVYDENDTGCVENDLIRRFDSCEI
jgi:hypothetical protein